jgi:hypothetical protein
MYVFKLRRGLGRLLAIASALLAMLVATGTAALAQVVPPSIGGGVVQPPLAPASAGGGMPGWQIALIAVGAALVAAVLAVRVDRARSARVRPAVDQPAAGSVPARIAGA